MKRLKPWIIYWWQCVTTGFIPSESAISVDVWRFLFLGLIFRSIGMVFIYAWISFHLFKVSSICTTESSQFNWPKREAQSFSVYHGNKRRRTSERTNERSPKLYHAIGKRSKMFQREEKNCVKLCKVIRIHYDFHINKLISVNSSFLVFCRMI